MPRAAGSEPAARIIAERHNRLKREASPAHSGGRLGAGFRLFHPGQDTLGLSLKRAAPVGFADAFVPIGPPPALDHDQERPAGFAGAGGLLQAMDLELEGIALAP